MSPEGGSATKNANKYSQDETDPKKLQMMKELSKVIDSRDKREVIENLFRSLDKDEESALESTLLSNAVSEFKKLREADSYNQGTLGSTRFNPYKTKYDSWNPPPLETTSKPLTQVSTDSSKIMILDLNASKAKNPLH